MMKDENPFPWEVHVLKTSNFNEKMSNMHAYSPKWISNNQEGNIFIISMLQNKI